MERPHFVQQRDVVAQQGEDFGGVGAMRTVAFNIGHSPKLDRERPFHTAPDQSTLNPEEDAADEGHPLRRWNVLANPTGCLALDPKERGKCIAALAGEHVERP